MRVCKWRRCPPFKVAAFPGVQDFGPDRTAADIPACTTPAKASDGAVSQPGKFVSDARHRKTPKTHPELEALTQDNDAAHEQ